jgi:hypothetical protein
MAFVHLSVREPELGNIANVERAVVFYACLFQLARYVLEKRLRPARVTILIVGHELIDVTKPD